MLFSLWVPPSHSNYFCFLTCLSICVLQNVSAPCLVGFLLCSNLFCLSIHLCSPVSECSLLDWIFYMSWFICLPMLSRMWVTLLGFFLYSNLSICLCSSVGKHLLLAQILSILIVCPSALSRLWVPLTCLDFLHVLTCLTVCTLQVVSASCSVGFFTCSNLSVHLCSLGCECPLLGRVLAMF